MIFGAVLAGGVGSRMKLADIPKQFLPLGKKPIIIHTVEKFLANDRFDYVYVGINGDWVLYFEDLLKKYGVNDPRLKIVAGGSDRNSTIMNVIDDINTNISDSDDDVIITHDAVRPFLTTRIINQNIDGVIKYGMCDTVISATDTIVVSEDGEYISEVPPRDKQYQGQTPQSFNINLLKKLYSELTDKQKAELTDACKICTLAGKKVRLIEGEVYNIKITTVSDYKIAQSILGGNLSD
ncbi:MAG: 2-C-methyl-D-erythritol 4-phosphate cytidylyltransferase [Oscillospiraceae bacterium]|jgi:2-C-methyl-D-erythritol 4-phosphate cytidylyltransferase|nr:2-C-methyl-D-erythritol 4-phosphate cytidylyltransferase [Oscillospiraceae bacterium]